MGDVELFKIGKFKIVTEDRRGPWENKPSVTTVEITSSDWLLETVREHLQAAMYGHEIEGVQVTLHALIPWGDYVRLDDSKVQELLDC